MSSPLDGNSSAAPPRHQQPGGTILYRLPRPADLASRLATAAMVFLALVVPLVVPLFLVPRQHLPLVLIASGLLLAVSLVIAVWFLLGQLRPLLTPRELQLGKGELVAVRCIGPLSWKRRRALARIELLVIRADASKEADLEIVSHGAAPLRLIQPLPLEQLRPFARELAEELTRLDPSDSDPVQVREEIAAAPGEHGQPTDSRIIVVEQGGSLVLTIPPLRPSSGRMLLLVLAGGVYLLASLAYTVWLLSFVFSAPGPTSIPWWQVYNLFLFWILGVQYACFALYHGSRRMVVTVSAGGLQVEVVSLFRQHRRHWSHAEIGRIFGDDGGFCIQPVSGKLVRFAWPGSGPAEYRWLGTTVAQALEQRAAQAGSAPVFADKLAEKEDEP